MFYNKIKPADILLCAYSSYDLIFLLELLCETKGKKLGTLRCRGLKPPVVRGHAAAFRYWFNAFGHSGPYSQSIVEVEGQQKLIATGNPMSSPGIVFSFQTNLSTDISSLG